MKRKGRLFFNKTIGGDHEVPVTLKDKGAGSYDLIVKAPESGLYSINVGLPDQKGNIAEPLGNAPFEVKIDFAEGRVVCLILIV